MKTLKKEILVSIWLSICVSTYIAKYLCLGLYLCLNLYLIHTSWNLKVNTMFFTTGHHKMELNCRYFVITEIKPVPRAVCVWFCNMALFCVELLLPPVHLPVFIVISLNVGLMMSRRNSSFLTWHSVSLCTNRCLSAHYTPCLLPLRALEPPKQARLFQISMTFPIYQIFFFCPKYPFLLYSGNLQSSLKIQLKVSVQKLSFLLPGRPNDTFSVRSHHMLNLFPFVYTAGVINICFIFVSHSTSIESLKLNSCLSFYAQNRVYHMGYGRCSTRICRTNLIQSSQPHMFTNECAELWKDWVTCLWPDSYVNGRYFFPV